MILPRLPNAIPNPGFELLPVADGELSVVSTNGLTNPCAEAPCAADNRSSVTVMMRAFIEL
jgi:hypothetical protein